MTYITIYSNLFIVAVNIIEGVIDTYLVDRCYNYNYSNNRNSRFNYSSNQFSRDNYYSQDNYFSGNKPPYIYYIYHK